MGYVLNLNLIFDTTIPLKDAVNQLLRPLIGSFKATTADIIDNEGNLTAAYSSVIHADESEGRAVQIDKVAAIIDCHDVLTLDALETAYKRVITAKSLGKTDRPPPSPGETLMTMSLVVARSSDLTLEQISLEMGRLNGLAPSHFWPDAVSVLSTGVVNYSAHLPASDGSGDFFLPAAATVRRSPSPSIWVQKVIRPVGTLAFKTIASLVVGRLSIFQPGVQVLDYRELIKDMPPHGAATQTYQFNLAKTLVPMTREQSIAAQLPQDVFNVVSGKEKLGSVQYQTWQDGGVIVVRGAFPIDLFLIYLNGVVPGLCCCGGSLDELVPVAVAPRLAIVAYEEIGSRKLVAGKALEQVNGRGGQRNGPPAGLSCHRQGLCPGIECAAAGAGELAGATAGVHRCLDQIAGTTSSMGRQGSTLSEIEKQLAALGCAFQRCHMGPFLGGDRADPSVGHGFVQSGLERGQGAVGGGFREASRDQVQMPGPQARGAQLRDRKAGNLVRVWLPFTPLLGFALIGG